LGWPAVPNVSNRPYALQVWHDDDENLNLVDFRAPLQSGQTLTQGTSSTIEGDGVAWGSLHLSLRCWAMVGTLNCGAFPAQVVVPRATIGLTDNAAPTTTVAGGELAAQKIREFDSYDVIRERLAVSNWPHLCPMLAGI
jgi:hypothetical protein